MGNLNERKTFSTYPDGHPMCVAGQRRAALEATELLLDPGGGKAKDGIVKRALKAIFLGKKGATINKHLLISQQVYSAWQAGELDQYVDPITGNYQIQSPRGERYDRNVYQDLLKGNPTYDPKK